MFTLLSFFALLATVASQDHVITMNGIAFSPNTLTINVGETVQWSNQNGTHNVNGSVAAYPSNPAGFANGSAAAAPWTFQHTFTVPGVYQYRCDPHASLGMTGVITVNGAANGDVIISEINYNSPGGGIDSFEYIELYNKGTVAVQMEGWEFTSGINYTFPAHVLNPGEYVVVAYDAAKFNQAFGFTPLAWNTAAFNGLNNSGELIRLVDADSVFVDSVRYSTGNLWPTAANGQGPSLVLCDFNTDNGNPANWAAATTPSGYVTNNIEMLANPGAASDCSAEPVIGFSFPGAGVSESGGDVFVNVSISNGSASPTSVTLSASASSTATSPGDYTASLPVTLIFAGGVVAETQTVVISLVNDTDIEPTENLVLELTNPTNSAIISSGSFNITIQDDDTPLTGALLISGVFDAQPGAAGAKGVELKALADIPDLSIYGVGSASNGGGTDGEEISLPAMSLAEGECVYVASDSVAFMAYFGFNPIADGNGVSVNGDDAIELFENGQVIDVFGEISYTAGSTLAWNYLDGWAYRKDGTGPDGSAWNLNNWTIAANALNGGTDNASAPMPFPVCDYSTEAPVTAELTDDAFTIPAGAAATLDVLANDITPVVLTMLEIVTGPTNGTAVVNGVANITYTPAAGFCGEDSFTYEACDAGGCDQATVTITVECPLSYPAYDIADVTTVTGGAPDSLGVTCELRGIVYGIDYQGVTAAGVDIPAVQFYLNDGTGGISVFGGQNFGYTVEEGDEVIVRGEIVNFNCLTQVSDLDTIIKVSAGNALLPPSITTFLNESFESELVKFTNMELVDPSAWSPASTGFNVQIRSVISPTSPAITMRIDNDCELFNMPAPVGSFHATGIGGQFVTGGAGGCVDGYQFLPRFVSDIELLDATTESILAGKISYFPNPVSDELFIQSSIIIDDVIVSNALGQQLFTVKSPSNSISVGELKAGLYLISFKAEGAVWTTKFVKE